MKKKVSKPSLLFLGLDIRLESVYALHEVGTHIFPMIIRCTVGFHRNVCLVLVEKHLDQNIIGLLCVAVEHKLEVCAHREIAVVEPAAGVEVVEVGNL